MPEVDTLHWNGKLLLVLNVRGGTKKEDLPTVVSFENKEKPIAVPKLDYSSSKEQAQAVVTLQPRKQLVLTMTLHVGQELVTISNHVYEVYL